MKKRILLIVAIALSAISMQTSKAFATGISTTIYNSSDNSITFVENGITFSIFENGEFDFYLNSLSNGVNANYNSPGVSISFNSGYDYDPYVQYDSYGAIIQIENTPIYYDQYGRIKRAGVININYNSGRLHRIGGLSVYYNSYGNYSYCSGYINTYNRNYVYHPYHNWFARPYFGFTIVRVNPYRYNYNPYRYTYYRDNRYAYKHNRNRYDIRQQKRNTYNNTRRAKNNTRSNNDYRRTASTRSNQRTLRNNNTVRSQRNTQDVRRKTANNDRGVKGTSTRTQTQRRSTTPNRQRVRETQQRKSQTPRTTRSTQRKPSQTRSNTSRTATRQVSKSGRSSSSRSKPTSSRKTGRRR